MLPQDPMILYSYLNTQLRDKYSSLADLCEDLDEDMASVIDKMAQAGFKYDDDLNAFVRK